MTLEKAAAQETLVGSRHRVLTGFFVLVCAALTVTTALYLSSTARVRELTAAWNIPYVIISSPVGLLPLEDSLERSRTVSNVDTSQNRRLKEFERRVGSFAFSEEVRRRPGASSFDWYRTFDSKLSGKSATVVAVSNIFPFTVDSSWIHASDDVLAHWLSTADGALVRADVLAQQGWKVGDRVTVPTYFGSVSLQIVGEYDGMMPGFILAHWDLLDGLVPSIHRGLVSILAAPCVSTSCSALTSDLWTALAVAPAALEVTPAPERLGAIINEYGPTTGVLSLWSPALVLVLLVCVWLAGSEQKSAMAVLCGSGAGAMIGAGTLVALFGRGINLGIWAYAAVPIPWLIGAATVILPLLVAAMARVSALRVVGIVAAIAGVALAGMTIAGAFALRSDALDAVAHNIMSSDTSCLVYPPILSKDVPTLVDELNASPALSTARLVGVERVGTWSYTVSPGDAETFLIRGVLPGVLAAHADVRIEGWDGKSRLPSDAVWLGRRVMSRLKLSAGQQVTLLGRSWRVAGAVEAPAGSLHQSEAWCDEAALAARPAATQVYALVQPRLGSEPTGLKLPREPTVLNAGDIATYMFERSLPAASLRWFYALSVSLGCALALLVVFLRLQYPAIGFGSFVLSLLVAGLAGAIIVAIAAPSVTVYSAPGLLQPRVTGGVMAATLGMLVGTILLGAVLGGSLNKHLPNAGPPR